jgi:hypothetical protein
MSVAILSAPAPPRAAAAPRPKDGTWDTRAAEEATRRRAQGVLRCKNWRTAYNVGISTIRRATKSS